ncbi:hypothetical protein A4G20_07500 [Pasteurellaceae bacterium RH1A]|nr:hypothetical protein A4G20_07500 [Pasteurellaceae bacterium RH1A]
MLYSVKENSMANKFDGYKRLDFNESKKFEYNLKAIENAASFFNIHFLNKEVIYKTRNEEVSIVFNRTNFMHLCGVKYEDGAAEFFNLALRKQINFDKVFIKKDGTTFQKLSALNSIEFLLQKDISLSEGTIYLNLSFDKALRTKKEIIALTLIDADNVFIPQSLLNLKFMKNFPRGNNVVGIQSIHLQDKSVITYFPKDEIENK